MCLDLQAYLHVQWLRFQHVSAYSLIQENTTIQLPVVKTTDSQHTTTIQLPVRTTSKKRKVSRIATAQKGIGLSPPRSGGGGAAQGHTNQSSSAKSTTTGILAQLQSRRPENHSGIQNIVRAHLWCTSCKMKLQSSGFSSVEASFTIRLHVIHFRQLLQSSTVAWWLQH